MQKHALKQSLPFLLTLSPVLTALGLTYSNTNEEARPSHSRIQLHTSFHPSVVSIPVLRNTTAKAQFVVRNVSETRAFDVGSDVGAAIFSTLAKASGPDYAGARSVCGRQRSIGLSQEEARPVWAVENLPALPGQAR